MSPPDLVVVSNRGPVSFERENGSLVPRRGGGGLVSSLAPLLAGTGACWIAAAMSDEDREAAQAGLDSYDGISLRLVDVDPTTYAEAYETVANATLWFLHHGLFDAARHPVFNSEWRRAWEGYVRFNQAFAQAVAGSAPPGSTVLIQDYHLTLVAEALAPLRPDLETVHFTHTPFCDSSEIRMLPDFAARRLLGGMSAHGACGFHSPRWADSFRSCCREVLGSTPRTFVSPISADPADLARVARSPECLRAGEELDGVVAGRRLILRVDRMELSKNLLRGFQAYSEVLERRPDLRRQVVFMAVTYPSRERLAQYRNYRDEVEAMVASINSRWGSAGWEPIVLEISDDFPRSVAALQRYDVLVVNPVRDGLNLVAKEGSLVNRRNGVLALSREAGAVFELGDDALVLNPFDVSGTAQVLERALDMDPEERQRRSQALKAKSSARRPQDWLADQQDAITDAASHNRV